MDINWLWLVVGIVPYSIKRQQTKNEQVLTVKALFWRLTIRWRKGQCSWDVYIPFIDTCGSNGSKGVSSSLILSIWKQAQLSILACFSLPVEEIAERIPGREKQ